MHLLPRDPRLYRTWAASQISPGYSRAASCAWPCRAQVRVGGVVLEVNHASVVGLGHVTVGAMMTSASRPIGLLLAYPPPGGTAAVTQIFNKLTSMYDSPRLDASPPPHPLP